MKSGASLVLIIVLAVVCVGFGNCGARVNTRNIEKNMTENISDLEKKSGMKLPASAKILTAVKEGGHDGTKYEKWIIKAVERMQLKGNIIEGDDNETFMETLEQAAPGEKFGQPKTDKYEFSDWQNENGNWQAAAVETDAGFFLKLENIVLD